MNRLSTRPERFARSSGPLYYLRTSACLIVHSALRVGIGFVGLYLALRCVNTDLLTVAASLGVATFIALFHLGNFFAHFWIVASSKVERGDIIEIDGIGVMGCVVELAFMHVVLESIGPTTPSRCRECTHVHVPNALLTSYPLKKLYAYKS
jgi:small-conductance mechanosensitive channel